MTLAYIDSFDGLVPCKILKREGDEFHVLITADRRTSYHRGMVYVKRVDFVVPRNAISYHGGCSYIKRHRWNGLMPEIGVGRLWPTERETV